MKKYLAIVLCVILIFVITACDKSVNDTESNISVESQDTNNDTANTEKDKSNSSNKKTSKNNNKNNSSKVSEDYEEYDNYEYLDDESEYEYDSIPNYTNQSSNKPSSNDTENTDSLKQLDNGVLKDVSGKKMSVPENMKLLGTDDAKESNNAKNIKATAVLYQLDGNVVSWVTENDLIYVITTGNNRLVVINSKTMMAVANVPLSAKPAEINIIGDKIYISLPDICKIDVFSKSNYKKESSLIFDTEVSSFYVDGNYIYYTEHDQHCKAFKKNLITNEKTQICSNRGTTFYKPKLYLNKEDNILYVGETGSTGSALYYYDATTLEIIGVFRKDDYGIMNHTKEIFHIGDEIFWGNFRLSDTNPKDVSGRYGDASYGSINFASNELVSTFEGIFLTDTYECVVDYSDSGFSFEYLLITDSYNIFFRDRTNSDSKILGINFNIQ